MTIPPEFENLLARILAHFDQMCYPTWASRMFHTTRSAKARNLEKTYIPGVRAVWSTFTLAQKAAWKAAAGYTGYSNYQLFTADYSYRKKHNLSLPGTPYTTHQLYGLKMSNPLGTSPIRIRIHLKDLVGPIQIQFNYKKQEILPTGGDPFSFTATAYYFDAGLNLTHTKIWTAPAGNVSWGSVSETFGNAQRSYFHLVIEITLDNYAAHVFFDNFRVSDGGGAFYSDSFNKKVGEEWDYYPFYRKQGWAFDPAFAAPNFEVVYLDE